MLRSRRFVSAVGSGYASVLALSLFSLISISFAVRYLGREGFGVAATIIQITAFSQVLQLGVGPSVSRFIVDYRNGKDDPRLGSFVKTAFAIGAIQGAILVSLAFSTTGLLSMMFRVPPAFGGSFEVITLLSLCAAALGLVFNPAQQLLYAGQRIDLLNYISIVSQGTATFVLILGFVGGFGLFSYAVAAWVGSVSSAGLSMILARRLDILPRMRGVPLDWKILPSLARFSSNVMMVSLGLQLIAIAPAIVINRLLGAASMADWTIGTRLLQLGLQLTARVVNATEPTLWEIYANGQKHWAAVRLEQTLQIAAAVASVIGGVLLSLNGSFVALWSGGRVSWLWQYDLLGAAILLITGMAATWCMLPGITKNLGMFRYIYLAEGLAVLSLLFMPGAVTSPVSILLAILFSMMVIRVTYGALRASKDLGQSFREMYFSAAKLTLMWLAIIPMAGAVRYLLQGSQGWLSLVFWAIVCTAVFGIIAYKIGLSENTRIAVRQTMSHLTSRLSRQK